MIICSCSRITSGEIRRAVARIRAADGDVMLTPGKVYRALGKRPVCGGCLNLFVQQLYEPEGSPLPVELRDLRGTARGARQNEGRRKGHRVSELGASQRADGSQPVLAALPAAE